MKTLIVTRPSDQAADTIEALKTSGYIVLHAPSSEPEQITFDPPPHGNALIVTSQNGVRFGLSESAPPQHPIYAVGAKTAAAVRRLGFVNIVEGPGNAKDLVGVLRTAAQEQSLSFTHLCGEDLAYDVAGALQQDGINADSRPVYRMVPSSTLPGTVTRAFERDDIDGVLFYSARAAEIFEMLMMRAGLSSALSLCHAFAFSSRVERALYAEWRSTHHASEPTEESLFALIDRRLNF